MVGFVTTAIGTTGVWLAITAAGDNKVYPVLYGMDAQPVIQDVYYINANCTGGMYTMAGPYALVQQYNVAGAMTLYRAGYVAVSPVVGSHRTAFPGQGCVSQWQNITAYFLTALADVTPGSQPTSPITLVP